MVEDYIKMLLLTKTCLTYEEAFNKAVREMKDYNYIAKMGSLFDIEFK